MLKIREEQLKAFESAAMQRLEDRMVAHLHELAPQHCAAMGEANLRKVVKTGIKRAEKYGLTFKGPVRFYLDLMIMLGSDFDTDPQYPWAAELLNGSADPDQMDRAEALYERAMKYTAEVFGQNYEYELAAARRAGALKFQDLPSSATGSIKNLMSHLERVFPEKVRFIGELPISALVARARELSEQHRLDTERGPTVLAGLMFAFGHGVAADPQFPRVAATLAKDMQKPAVRTERLFQRAMTYQRLGETGQI
jgi:hypothetical protein